MERLTAMRVLSIHVAYIVSSLSQKHKSPGSNKDLFYSHSLALVQITVKQDKHLTVFRDVH